MELTKDDALNLIRIMNRAQFSGLQEAIVAHELAKKLDAIVKAADGKDVPPSNQ